MTNSPSPSGGGLLLWGKRPRRLGDVRLAGT